MLHSYMRCGVTITKFIPKFQSQGGRVMYHIIRALSTKNADQHFADQHSTHAHSEPI